MSVTTRSGHGVEEWYWQRLSAVVLLLLIPVMLWLLMASYHGLLNQAALQQLLRHPAIQSGHSLLAMAALLHAYIGMKIIIEDYVHVACIRTLLIAAGQLLGVLAAIDWLTLIWL